MHKTRIINSLFSVGLGAFTVTELSELVRDAILGEATSVGIITDLGINFVRALISENLVSQLQGQSLLSLFPQSKGSVAFLTCG